MSRAGTLRRIAPRAAGAARSRLSQLALILARAAPLGDVSRRGRAGARPPAAPVRSTARTSAPRDAGHPRRSSPGPRPGRG
ncbi:hypothetical protein G6F59_018609 [Rhizopus arrhizus]|nr:hypothetical protein G6F59_018609 [Rhizopus arrhizus]